MQEQLPEASLKPMLRQLPDDGVRAALADARLAYMAHAANVRRFGRKHEAARFLTYKRLRAWAESKTHRAQDGRDILREAVTKWIPHWRQGYAMCPLEVKVVMREVMREVGRRRLRQRGFSVSKKPA